ncbi:MAG TPA: terminase TerL endonuclease subunit [Anaerolineaceae bacterium]|nr:terminase TerL endonuclease subunit [Anaerolineaceae bacterium]
MAEYKATVDQYIAGVLDGTTVACKWVKLACERHLQDIDNGPERGLYFDQDKAERAIKFFSILHHSKGEWAGQPVTLEPWQMFIIWCVFGWLREDGTRRFRTAYEEVARKNGKSTMAAGVGLLLFAADGEPGAEVYTAATKKDQACITHSEATRMVKSSPMLRKRVSIFKNNLNIEGTASKFEPLGRDSDTHDGLNVHGAIVDELHAHKNREMWDILETATGSRRQPLMFAITTAGYNRHTICFEMHEYAEKVLSGVIVDDSFFGIIFCLDEGDDWEDEKNWIKANPNLGVSKKLDNMREKASKAKEMPSALNSFLRLELNVWTQSETKWINLEAWKNCGISVDADGVRGRTCYAGLDLSSNTDISALVLVFPPESEDDLYQVLCRFFIPKDAIYERTHRDRVPYEAWVRQGYIHATSGNVIDYDFILSQLDQDAQTYDLREVAFDRWGATKIIQEIEEKGLTCVQFGQGFMSMSPPMKQMETLILSTQLAHANNPVLTWMADNLVASVDPAGNIKPDKAHSIERIDGMVALIMALDRAIRNEGFGRSVYEERGIAVLGEDEEQ